MLIEEMVDLIVQVERIGADRQIVRLYYPDEMSERLRTMAERPDRVAL